MQQRMKASAGSGLQAACLSFAAQVDALEKPEPALTADAVNSRRSRA
jgi:hypothetical protein